MTFALNKYLDFLSGEVSSEHGGRKRRYIEKTRPITGKYLSATLKMGDFLKLSMGNVLVVVVKPFFLFMEVLHKKPSCNVQKTALQITCTGTCEALRARQNL